MNVWNMTFWFLSSASTARTMWYRRLRFWKNKRPVRSASSVLIICFQVQFRFLYGWYQSSHDMLGLSLLPKYFVRKVEQKSWENFEISLSFTSGWIAFVLLENLTTQQPPRSLDSRRVWIFTRLHRSSHLRCCPNKHAQVDRTSARRKNFY